MQKPARPENPVALLPLTRPDGQQEKEASLKSKRLSAISAVALMSALSFASVVPASAQAIFSSPRAAASAGLNPNAANNPNAMNPNATGDPAPSATQALHGHFQPNSDRNHRPVVRPWRSCVWRPHPRPRLRRRLALGD